MKTYFKSGNAVALESELNSGRVFRLFLTSSQQRRLRRPMKPPRVPRLQVGNENEVIMAKQVSMVSTLATGV